MAGVGRIPGGVAAGEGLDSFGAIFPGDGCGGSGSSVAPWLERPGDGPSRPFNLAGSLRCAVQEMKDHQDEAMTKLLHGLDALLVVRLESMCGRVHAKEVPGTRATSEVVLDDNGRSAVKRVSSSSSNPSNLSSRLAAGPRASSGSDRSAPDPTSASEGETPLKRSLTDGAKTGRQLLSPEMAGNAWTLPCKPDEVGASGAADDGEVSKLSISMPSASTTWKKTRVGFAQLAIDTGRRPSSQSGCSNVSPMDSHSSKSMTAGVKFKSEEGSSDDEPESESPRQAPRGGRAIRFSQIEARHRARSMAVDQSELDRVSEGEDVPPSCAERMVKSRQFEVVSATALCLNAFAIGLQVESFARGQSDAEQVAYQVLNYLFCVYFLVELVLRIIGISSRAFFFGSDRAWNFFDSVVVFLQVFEATFTIFTTMFLKSTELPRFSLFVGVVRMSRVVRIIRLVSVLRWLRPFRVLITAIFGTLRSCIWAVLLLCLIIYVFGIVLTQSVAEHMQERYPHGLDGAEVEGFAAELQKYYGTLPRSLYTLFKAIIGGIDWEAVAEPLSDLGAVPVCLFLTYISFVLIAVMNVVQGLFLQSAIEQAQTDQEHVIQLRLKEKAHFVERLQYLFGELDATRDGVITLAEFESQLKDERMQAFLQSFEIEPSDAWTLFRLLDADGGGTVDVDEFVAGCIRLKGSAKSIQVAQLAFHHKWIMEKLADIAEVVVCQAATAGGRGLDGPPSPAGSETLTAYSVGSDTLPKVKARPARAPSSEWLM